MTTFLFDFYGVLLRHRTLAEQNQLVHAVGAEDPDEFWRVVTELRPAYDAGLVSDESYWAQVRSRLGLPEFDVQDVVDADFRYCTGADEEMRDFALGLVDAGHTVGALSNIPLGLAAMVRRDNPWLDNFAALTLSCDIGLAKPDPRAYAVAVDALGARPEDTFFIDDTAANVEAARALGLQAHYFDGIAGLRAAVGGLAG